MSSHVGACSGADVLERAVDVVQRCGKVPGQLTFYQCDLSYVELPLSAELATWCAPCEEVRRHVGGLVDAARGVVLEPQRG